MEIYILDVIIPVSIMLFLTLVHFIGEKISSKMKRFHAELESLGAGLMVGILFLELLPHIFKGYGVLDFYIYIPLLAGFVIIALAEKIVYKIILKENPTTKLNLPTQDNDEEKHLESPNEYEKEIMGIECIIPEQNAIFEAIALLTHSFMIGILVALVFSENEINASFIIMIPFLIRAFTVSFSAEQIMEDLNEKPQKIFRIINLIIPTLGALFGVFLVFSEIAFFIIFAFALGLVLFTVIRDIIPLGKKGKPVFFLIGIVLTIGIFLLNELVLH
ncbi:MAG: hypothetical protein KGD59_11250 [Candidatus Heimdallarchaeota archaeon]|nr:hypothetical protein [Candidatus Heimdallarchaeota archaeon]MBY8995118.1 hypothetical protein [Candidatus Heimdallarchaeota archaeon]